MADDPILNPPTLLIPSHYRTEEARVRVEVPIVDVNGTHLSYEVVEVHLANLPPAARSNAADLVRIVLRRASKIA